VQLQEIAMSDDPYRLSDLSSITANAPIEQPGNYGASGLASVQADPLTTAQYEYPLLRTTGASFSYPGFGVDPSLAPAGTSAPSTAAPAATIGSSAADSGSGNSGAPDLGGNWGAWDAPAPLDTGAGGEGLGGTGTAGTSGNGLLGATVGTGTAGGTAGSPSIGPSAPGGFALNGQAGTTVTGPNVGGMVGGAAGGMLGGVAGSALGPAGSIAAGLAGKAAGTAVGNLAGNAVGMGDTRTLPPTTTATNPNIDPTNATTTAGFGTAAAAGGSGGTGAAGDAGAGTGTGGASADTGSGNAAGSNTSDSSPTGDTAAGLGADTTGGANTNSDAASQASTGGTAGVAGTGAVGGVTAEVSTPDTTDDTAPDDGGSTDAEDDDGGPSGASGTGGANSTSDTAGGVAAGADASNADASSDDGSSADAGNGGDASSGDAGGGASEGGNGGDDSGGDAGEGGGGEGGEGGGDGGEGGGGDGGEGGGGDGGGNWTGGPVTAAKLHPLSAITAEGPVMPAPPQPQKGFAIGGVVTPTRLIGPKPNNPDDGYGSLQDGEFVVRQPEAEEYAAILRQINAGTFHPGDDHMSGSIPDNDPPDQSAQGDPGAFPTTGADDTAAPLNPDDPNGMGFVANSDTQQSPLAPPPPLTPDAAMQNLAMMPEQQRQVLAMALGDPTTGGALLTLLGPTFAPVLSALTANSVPTGLPAPGTPGAPPMPGGAPQPGGDGLPPGHDGSWGGGFITPGKLQPLASVFAGPQSVPAWAKDQMAYIGSSSVPTWAKEQMTYLRNLAGGGGTDGGGDGGTDGGDWKGGTVTPDKLHPLSAVATEAAPRKRPLGSIQA
jgi:hypothetical protein